METNSVQNQKVFVTLKSVLDLQKEYHRTKVERDKADSHYKPIWTARLEALEFVFRTLALPIER